MSTKLVYLLDYDDSILCSSVLTLEARRQKCDIMHIRISPILFAKLRQLAACVMASIKAMQQYGTVYILTNAESGWVPASCARFIPELLPLIKTLAVISAIDLYRSKSLEKSVNGADWKYFAIIMILGLENRHDIFLFSIGDSNDERDATRRVRNECAANEHGVLNYKSPAKVRILKLADNPTIDGLIRQHNAIKSCIAYLIRIETNDDITLQLPLAEHAFIRALVDARKGEYKEALCKNFLRPPAKC